MKFIPATSGALLCSLCLLLACKTGQKAASAPQQPFEVIAYYSGNGLDLDRYRFDQLTQVIFSFCHLRGDELTVDDAQDTLTINKLVALKKQHPRLKILLSLGGWCGCKACSDVFSSEKGRATFVSSTVHLLKTFGADGLDLDWEYPGIEGCPQHPWKPDDRENFTRLVVALREAFGQQYELSFAAGGFKSFFDNSVEWGKVMPLLDRVNLMSYDLVSGFSKKTGHHTPLFSSKQQQLSVDYGVRYLDSIGVPRAKIVIGAAFYARTWEGVDPVGNGLFLPGKFKKFVSYSNFSTYLNAENGFVFYRDSVAKAPYAYSVKQREFATFDDPISVAEKTRYAKKSRLGGIMFWSLNSDVSQNGMLEAIYKASLE